VNKNNATVKRSWPTSFSILATYHVLSTQPTIIVNNRYRRSQFVYNICDLTQAFTGGRINSWIFFYLKPGYLPRTGFGGWFECGNRIGGDNFCIVFCSNCGSILLSFWDVTMGRTTDGRRMDWRWQASHNIWALTGSTMKTIQGTI